jgi:hypothetical protein
LLPTTRLNYKGAENTTMWGSPVSHITLPVSETSFIGFPISGKGASSCLVRRSIPQWPFQLELTPVRSLLKGHGTIYCASRRDVRQITTRRYGRRKTIYSRLSDEPRTRWLRFYLYIWFITYISHRLLRIWNTVQVRQLGGHGQLLWLGSFVPAV